MMRNFDDNVLLRLRRLYSRDEAVKFISDRLMNAEIEIGVLKSELSEALENCEKVREDKNKLELAKESIRMQNARGRAKIKEQTKMLIFWRDRYLSLKAKTEKNELDKRCQ